MALYKTHTKFNLIIGFPIISYLLFLLFHPVINYYLSFSFCFCYSTLFMNPDMDLANKIKLFSLKGLMTLPFRLYSVFFNHRGLSHNLFFGTLSRVLFLSLVYVGILSVIDYSFVSKKLYLNFWDSYRMYIIYGFSGLFTADLCHLLLDLKKTRK